MPKSTEVLRPTPSYTLNAICPYFTMFPLSFPATVLQAESTAGNWVLDPFCGRGTTNFASRLAQSPSVGIDSSPVATAIAHSKLLSVNVDDVVELCGRILADESLVPSVPEGEFWELAFHKKTLLSLTQLRESLLHDSSTPDRKALRALLLGALHGPLTKTFPSYLSNQCPRTYAPKPNYAVKFWKERNLRPPEIDVKSLVQRRAWRYFSTELPTVTGDILTGDSRMEDTFGRLDQKFNLVITSPPYYGMRTYLPDQWLRSWFVGGPSSIDYSYGMQLSHGSQNEFAAELRSVWQNCASVCAPNARLVIRFGCINDRRVDPVGLASNSLNGTGWEITSVHSAGTAASGRRQVSQFAREPKLPHEEFDISATLQRA